MAAPIRILNRRAASAKFLVAYCFRCGSDYMPASIWSMSEDPRGQVFWCCIVAPVDAIQGNDIGARKSLGRAEEDVSRWRCRMRPYNANRPVFPVTQPGPQCFEARSLRA